MAPTASVFLSLVAVFGWTRSVEAQVFLRGEINGEEPINITDAVHVLQSLWRAQPLSCSDAADVDDSGALDINDAVYLLNYLFRRGAQLPAPFPGCGADPTDDKLGCDEFALFCSCPNLSGDTFAFIIDRSGGFGASGQLSRAKEYVIQDIEVLSCFAHFAVLFFDAGLMRFPQAGQPVRATDEMKEFAIDFIRSVAAGSGTCNRPALLAALAMPQPAGSQRRLILFLSDGGGTCRGANEEEYLNGTLKAVAEANVDGAQINTILNLTEISCRRH